MLTNMMKVKMRCMKCETLFTGDGTCEFCPDCLGSYPEVEAPVTAVTSVYEWREEIQKSLAELGISPSATQIKDGEVLVFMNGRRYKAVQVDDYRGYVLQPMIEKGRLSK